MIIGDACCFLNERGKDPLAQKNLVLNFGVATATPPTLPLENGKGSRPLTMEESVAEIKKFKKAIITQPKLSLIFRFSDVATTDKGRTGVVLGLQNTPLDADPEVLFDMGIRVMSLAYYSQNQYGSGFANAEIGLTEDGRNLIRKCAEVGIIVDFSHVGHQTVNDAISFIEENHLNCKVMASHGGCVAEYHHLRNISDKAMKGIVRLGGVVGITTITFNLDEKDNKISPFIRHLSHAINVCGENNVCIGTDSVYENRSRKEAEEGIKRLRPRLDPLDIQGIRYPENIYEGPKLMSDICATIMAPNISTLLAFPGYTEQGRVPNVNGVMGQNLLDFLARALPA